MPSSLKKNEIRVLAVKQPYASLIVEGLKTIEIRSRPTNIMGKIAIYASTSKQETLEGEHGPAYNYRILPTGYIIGTVEIFDCVDGQDFTSSHFDALQTLSLAPTNMITNDAFYWRLEHPIKFAQPIPYKPPKGAIVWSKTVLPEGY